MGIWEKAKKADANYSAASWLPTALQFVFPTSFAAAMSWAASYRDWIWGEYGMLGVLAVGLAGFLVASVAIYISGMGAAAWRRAKSPTFNLPTVDAPTAKAATTPQPYVSNQAISASCSFNDPGPESAVSYFGTLASTGTRLRIFIDLWNGPGGKYHRRKIAEIRDYVRGQDIRIPIVTRFFSPAPDWVFTWGQSNDQISDRFSVSRYAGRVTLLNDTGVEQYCYFLIVPTRINGVDYPEVLDSKHLHFIEEWESREAAQR